MTELQYALRGEIDVRTAPDVRVDLHALIQRSPAPLRVDCAELTFIDSTGVAVLLETEHELQRRDLHIRITNVRPGPRRVFELLGLSDLLIQ
jgi:anti-sigma B factor antagonist